MGEAGQGNAGDQVADAAVFVCIKGRGWTLADLKFYSPTGNPFEAWVRTVDHKLTGRGLRERMRRSLSQEAADENLVL